MGRIALVLFLMTAAVAGIVLAADSSVQANPGFKLPWSAGETYEVRQTRGGPTHDCPGYNCYAYDFSLPLGTPVTASASGRVVAADGSNSIGGCDDSLAGRANYVYILHQDGSRSLYLHLNDVRVSRGQKVAQGQLIGHSGRTGYACRAHLHFQRDVDGASAPVYFDEYPGLQLHAFQWATSRNSKPSTLANAALPCDPNDYPADFNDSQEVDSRDAFLLARRLGSSTVSTPQGKLPYSARYDLNGDGAINGLDSSILAQHFNTACP